MESRELAKMIVRALETSELFDQVTQLFKIPESIGVATTQGEYFIIKVGKSDA